MKTSTSHLIIWMNNVATLLLTIVNMVLGKTTKITGLHQVVQILGYFLVLFLIGCYLSLLLKWVQTWEKRKIASRLEKVDSNGHRV